MMKSEEDDEERPFACHACDYRSKRYDALTRHIRIHAKQSLLSCDICNKTLKGKEALRRHVNRQHLTHGGGDFECLLCDILFSTKDRLDYHVRSVHNEPDTLEACAHCSYTARNRRDVVRHINRRHNASMVKKEQLQCTECAFTTKSQLRLFNHCKQHDFSSRKCPECDFVATYAKGLKGHIQRIHDDWKAYACDKCSYRAARLSLLNAHQVKHSGVRRETEKSHLCPQCNKLFITKIVLNVHISAVHEKMRRFKCVQCDCSYLNYSSLWTHKKSVHGEAKREDVKGNGKKRAMCNECNFVARNSSGLHRHWRQQHASQTT